MYNQREFWFQKCISNISLVLVQILIEGHILLYTATYKGGSILLAVTIIYLRILLSRKIFSLRDVSYELVLV